MSPILPSLSRCSPRGGRSWRSRSNSGRARFRGATHERWLRMGSWDKEITAGSSPLQLPELIGNLKLGFVWVLLQVIFYPHICLQISWKTLTLPNLRLPISSTNYVSILSQSSIAKYPKVFRVQHVKAKKMRKLLRSSKPLLRHA